MKVAFTVHFMIKYMRKLIFNLVVLKSNTEVYPRPTTDETPTPSTKKKKKKKNRRQQALEEEDLYDVSELNQNPP